MNNSTKLALLALTGAVSTLGATANAMEPTGEGEKCYGVAKAGSNDCGSIHHGCAGVATEDADSTEWVFVPKGLCDKLVGGSLESGE
tara:strand:- start:31612 stop:31872 length:261 start_codon:yes stop_codon:yes gene_type:complete